jgi:O-antigen biosynthesis protein
MQSNSRQKILVVSPSIPKPDFNAGDRRFFAVLQLLANHYSVNLWMASGPLPDPESWKYVHQVSELSIKVLNSTCSISIDEALTHDYYQIIFFEFYWMAEPFLDVCRRYQPHAKTIIDSVDVSFARELIAAELGVIEKKQAEETKQKELNIYGKVDATIAVSQLDYDILHAENARLKLFIVPIIMPIQEQSINPNSKELVFIGGFKWEPNIDGIQWFVKEIWDSIRSRIPDAIVTVIGSNPTEGIIELGNTLGVNVVGYVPETNPYLKRAAISIAPLRYGGGMKGKVNEAMSLGLPVVTTSVGAQGLNAISGQHLLIADEPMDFAEAVISLLESPSYRAEMGLAGQQLTADLCSPEVAEKVLREMFDSLISQKQSLPLLVAQVRYTVIVFLLKSLGFTHLWDLAKRFRRKVKSFSAT